ncbi:MAG: ADP-ribosylglycohydrolase family protein [Dehalococcoidales bacterium]|nr:ADP-ribosylglycohydrolase family protein [Dehalococcoidales bacterium]
MKHLGGEMQGEKLRSKFLGCLLGVAIGDALGACREGREMAQEGEIDYLIDKLGWLTYTDDTHMTIGIAESLVAVKGLFWRAYDPNLYQKL